MPEPHRRKSAAIVFTDIEGYTALLGQDDQAGLAPHKDNQGTT